jgi:hypothetical protein
MPRYTRIPTLSAWQSDSNVLLAIRRTDTVLHRIDTLVSAFDEAPLHLMRGIACDMYFSIDYWLQHVKTNRNMDQRREPAMRELYLAVVDFLCGVFNCTVNLLPRELDLMFGRELSELGFKIDFEFGRAQYLQRKELENCKIWFKGGLAYQWGRHAEQRVRTLLNSANSHNPEAFVVKEGQLPNPGYGAFILTMDRNLYMARHQPGENKAFNGFYHSSYLAGQAVMAAGSMLVEAGRIRRMRSDSGHYKPFDTNMLQVLQTLKMLGMPIHDIMVEDFRGRNAVKAPVFWVANGEWDKLKQRRDENLKERQGVHGYKEDRRNPTATANVGPIVDTPYEVND